MNYTKEAGYGRLATSGLPFTGSGKVFFVGDSSTANLSMIQDLWKVDHGDGYPRFFSTVDAAINACTANAGDVIFVAPGHTETLATASAITSDVAGVSIIGLGNGADRPTFTFSAVDSTWVVSAASTKIKNIIITNSIDAVVSPLVVSGVDCEIDIESRDATNLKEFTDVILTTATADNLKIKLKHVGFTTGSGNTRAVHLVGGNNTRVDIDFYGLATTAVVDFTTAVVDCNVFGYMYNSGTTDYTKSVIDTATGSTWFAEFYDGGAGASVQGGSGNALAAGDLSAISTAVSTTIPGLHAVPTADATTNTNLRDVAGNKTDAAVGAVTTNKSLMGYVKGVLEDTGTTLPALHAVPTADVATNTNVRDVVGNKTDAAVGAVGTDKSAIAYLKGILTDTIEIGAAGAGLTVLATQSSVDAIQTDLGNPSARANFQTLEAMLDIPDAANSSLDDIIRTGFDSTSITPSNNGSVLQMLKALDQTATKLSTKNIADLTGFDTAPVFNVTGDVMVRVFGVVGAAAITTTSGTTTLSVGTTADPAVILPATTVDNSDFAIGDVWTDNNPENDASIVSATDWVVIGNGGDIVLTRSVDDLTAGVLSLYCEWKSLSPGSSVAAV